MLLEACCHLYGAAFTEPVEEQFGNEETVAAAYLKTIYDHRAIPEDNLGLLQSYTLQSLP